MDNSIFAATLNSISAHVAVLNEAGEIIYVNEAWKRFADNNSLRASNYGVGTSYLNVCDTEEGTSPLSGWFARLIDDRRGEFRLDYPCHSPTEKRWFQMRVTCFESKGQLYIVVVHENISEIKIAEELLLQTRDELATVNRTLRQTMSETISALARAIEQRDPYTDGHQKRVSLLATAIARRLGHDENFVTGVEFGSLLHDIGKIHIPAEILSNPRRLSEIEHTLVRTHAQSGFEILKDSHFPWPLAEMIYQHHEKLDGSGYPRHLLAEQILPEARIIAVADVTEAISSHRPYRPALGTDMALQELQTNRGKLYDAAACDACIEILTENPDFWNRENVRR
ncbi:MAG: HD domain-containing protein [Turneriella sp.]